MNNIITQPNYEIEYKFLEKFKLEKAKEILSKTMEECVNYIGELNKKDSLL